MSVRRFRLSVTLDAPPEDVIDFLMELDGHQGLHPYLQSAEVVATGRDAEGPWWEWRVVERPAVGSFRYTLSFPARMTRLGPDAMRGRVKAAPGCHLETVTRASRTERGTVVEEETTVTAPWPLVGYMTKHASLAHARTFSLLPTELVRES